MIDLIDGAGAIIAAFYSADSWQISEALDHPGAYLFGCAWVLIGGFGLMQMLHALPLLDKYLERVALNVTYMAIAGIIFVEVIRRFVFHLQAPWSTTLPPYLFLIMTWVGCAYNARLRTHLCFSELRATLPRKLQFACLSLDALLWLVFALIVTVTTLRQTANSAANFQILLGTDNVMQWWFYMLVPASWLILSARVIENFLEDIRRFRMREPLVRQISLLAD